MNYWLLFSWSQPQEKLHALFLFSIKFCSSISFCHNPFASSSPFFPPLPIFLNERRKPRRPQTEDPLADCYWNQILILSSAVSHEVVQDLSCSSRASMFCAPEDIFPYHVLMVWPMQASTTIAFARPNFPMDIDMSRRNRKPRLLEEEEMDRLREYVDSIHYSARYLFSFSWQEHTYWKKADIPMINTNIATSNFQKICSRKFRPIISIVQKAHWNCFGSKSGVHLVLLR